MGKALTTEEFIEKSRGIHGDRYDYSRVEYHHHRTAIEIICPFHGAFFQEPTFHLRGSGCQACGRDTRGNKTRFSTAEFIERARQVHGDKYDYSKVAYRKRNRNIEIFCKEHNRSFLQLPFNHLYGAGCPDCMRQKMSDAKVLTQDEYLQRAKQIHGDRYDYSQVEYRGARRRIKIICLMHGEFWQLPNNHLVAVGCPKCSAEKMSERFSSTTAEFIIKAHEIHGQRYSYSKVDYKSAKEKVQIICYKHGVFHQSPNQHLKGHGCPFCKSSGGERKVAEILTSWGIHFTHQKKFDRCKDIRPLPFDFYFQIGKIQFLIEYDGQVHYRAIDRWGGEQKLLDCQRRDSIKTQFAKDNGFILVRIPYWELGNMVEILRNEIEKHVGSIEKVIKKKQRKTKVNPINPIDYKQGLLFMEI